MSPRSRRQFGSVTKMRSGRYQASYVGPDGSRHLAPHTFNSKSEADVWLAGQHAAMVAQTWTPNTPLRPAAVAARAAAEAAAAKKAKPTLGTAARIGDT